MRKISQSTNSSGGEMMVGIMERNKIMDVQMNQSPENLTQGEVGREYRIKEIISVDEELKNFLFTLGCYEGEHVTVISVLSENYVVSVKDSRYSIDKELAEAIVI